jgi:glycyl-tRNA synthetase beta chain
MSATRDLLLEIGCEELPASFVEAALRALPELVHKKLTDLRLAHGAIRALGTPRRLAVLVSHVAERQPDLEEEVTGPPVKAAFKDGVPTKAAEAFASKIGCAVADLRRVETPKGEYLVGTRREVGQGAASLLPDALGAVITAIPFRKSMRWGTGEFAFGRPIHWIVALFGPDVIDVGVAGVKSGRTSRGHRFLAPETISFASADTYVDSLRAAHVLVDPTERARVMRERLLEAAAAAGGTLIEDDFLIG